MKQSGMLWVILGIWIGLQTACVGFARAADDYLLGSDDVIGVTIWDHPDLSRTVVVRANGAISFPPLGDVPAAGKSATVLAQDIEARLASLLRLNAQVTVSVVNFNSQKVFLSGAVNSPGKFSFEVIPGMMDVLGSGGGLSPTADLTQVRILRKTGDKTKTFTVDLATALRTGDFSTVPPLLSGDVIFVPAATAGASSVGGGSAIYFGGEVAKPGAFGAIPGLNLIQGLSMAGGVTPRGDLSRVMVLSTGASAQGYVVQVDVLRDLAEGRGGVSLRPGDTVWVLSQNGTIGSVAWNTFRETLGLSQGLANLILVRNNLKK